RGEERALSPQAGLDEYRKTTRGGPPARSVAVEAGDDAFREAPQDAQLLDRQRGAERRHHLFHARLGQGDHVEIPLDDDDTPGPTDRIARVAEPVKGLSLAEARRLGRIEILVRRMAGGWMVRADAPPSGDAPTARVR